MNASKPPESLPAALVSALTKEIMRWDGKYPLHWHPKLDEALRNPKVFKAFLTMHAVVWGPSPELADTHPPVSKGADDQK